ncbi:hypothetical protein FACS18949_11720 [Clostridia bacterium]|nr:hypothetical protein FACS189425_06530 [Clostridia bacterium]GHV34871.1 hypothetical protein FACS18949_11720 [Clostridia bacterium]
MALISVVLPVYNSEQFLSEAVESILAQTFQDWELLAVCEPDSNDSSDKVLAKYAQKDNRIHVISNTQRLGLAASLNVGIRLANGEFIARMDSDDISLPNRFSVELNYMQNHPETSIVGCNAKFIGNSGKYIGHTDSYEATAEQLKSDLMFWCNVRHPTAFFRKSDIYKYDLFYDENYPLAEDFELWTRGCHKARIENIPDILLLYRWRVESQTHANEQRGAEIHQKIMRRSFEAMGIDFSNAEIRYLCPLFDMPLTKEARKILTVAANRIIAANQECKLYEETALDNTLRHVLYWKWYRFRCLLVTALQRAGASNTTLRSTARYLQRFGVGSTIKRGIRTILERK